MYNQLSQILAGGVRKKNLDNFIENPTLLNQETIARKYFYMITA